MIAVTATSFMKEPRLRLLLQECFPNIIIRFIEAEQSASEAALIFQLKGAKAWLVGRETVSKRVVDALPDLKVIAKYGVGLDNIDFDACHHRGIRIVWEAGVNREAVAEHTLGLMLALSRNIGLGSRRLSQGVWWKNGGSNLTGKCVGLVGLGHIGYRVAELLKVFRCTIKFCDILDKSKEASELGAHQVAYTELLEWADILSFHVPLTGSTRGMLNRSVMVKTRAGVRIINTSRGEVIVESDIKEFLHSGHIAGFGADVFEHEPLEDKELYSMDNFIGTAHTAGNSQEAIWAMGASAVKGLQKELGFS